jgi:hypothetical protein
MRDTFGLMVLVPEVNPTEQELNDVACAFALVRERAKADGEGSLFGSLPYGGRKVAVLAEPGQERGFLIDKTLLLFFIRTGIGAMVDDELNRERRRA